HLKIATFVGTNAPDFRAAASSRQSAYAAITENPATLAKLDIASEYSTSVLFALSNSQKSLGGETFISSEAAAEDISKHKPPTAHPNPCMRISFYLWLFTFIIHSIEVPAIHFRY